LRRKRNIDRQAGKLADASLIVIASEDRYAVKQYFAMFHSPKIEFRVLETEDGASSPADVLERLDNYRKEFQIGEGDQLWLVTDIDHWADPGHVSNLTAVIQQCKSKEIGIAPAILALTIGCCFTSMIRQQRKLGGVTMLAVSFVRLLVLTTRRASTICQSLRNPSYLRLNEREAKILKAQFCKAMDHWSI
jgi:hypothetical protein